MTVFVVPVLIAETSAYNSAGDRKIIKMIDKKLGTIGVFPVFSSEAKARRYMKKIGREGEALFHVQLVTEVKELPGHWDKTVKKLNTLGTKLGEKNHRM